MHLVLKRCERFGVWDMKTEHYLPVIAVYAIGTIVKVRPIYLFLSVIEDIYVLLITGFSYSFTLFFSRYSTFSVIRSIYFITHIILNSFMTEAVIIWFLYDNGLCHERVNVTGNGSFINKRMQILTAKLK